MRPALDSQVLVLNRLWQPVNICSARRAFSLLFLGRAHVVHSDEENNYFTHDIDSWKEHSRDHRGADMVWTITECFRVPSIIVLSMFDRLPKKEVKFTRHNVFVRDNFTCQYCSGRFDAKDLNLDHVVPRDKGGKTTWENVVCSCIRCNTRKANKMPSEARMFPGKEPKAPKWRPFFSAAGMDMKRLSNDNWRTFVDLRPGQVAVTE